MRRIRPLWRFMAAALLVLLPTPISAVIGPPVAVRLVGELHPAKAGERYEMVAEIRVYEDGELSGFRLGGNRWSAMQLAAPARFALAKDQSREVRLTAVPDDPNEPLVFEFEYNGHTTRWNFDVSEEFVQLMQGPHATAPASGRLPTPPPGWTPPPPPDDDAAAEPDAAPGAGAYTITVHGWFGYYRVDGEPVGAPDIAIGVTDVRRNAQEVHTTIGTGNTDDFGYFSIPCTFTPTTAEPYPDIQLAFNSYSFNGRVEMITPVTYTRYQWVSDIKPDVTGVDVDFGGLVPAAEQFFGALEVYTDVFRSWHYCYYHAYWDTPPVGVMWPDLAHSRYTPWQDLIHIPASASWEEGTHSHEYGHHWMYKNSSSPTPDYCNGMCDSPECTHCGWCWEKGAIALTEGFPDFMGWAIPLSYTLDYGLYAINGSDYDYLGRCREDDTFHDPYFTEGFLAAALQDICDGNAHPDSHFVFGPYADALHLDPAMCFWVAGTRYPGSASDYLMQFLAEYPEVKNGLWETAMNCGYQIDLYLPGMVGQLTSPTHELNVESTIPNVVLTWNAADDDASGIAGYSLRVAPDTDPPDYTMDIGPVETTTVGPLQSGTYYFGLRALDRAGRWSESVVAYGPVIIGEVTSADLEFEHRVGWSRELVPRSSTDATLLWCPDPGTLVGNMTATWWNMSWRNAGSYPTPGSYGVGVYLDGRVLPDDHVTMGPLGALASALVVNGGPILALGGRHTLEGVLDRTDAFLESNEYNNRWAHQWVWTPEVLTYGDRVVRNVPPRRSGGWSSVVDGSTLWFNCVGYRFQSGQPWTAVMMRATDNDVDYDCRLHAASSGATNGFAGNIGYSTAAPGYLDMLVVNRNTMGTANWDVGVLRKDDQVSSDYEVTMAGNGYLSIGDSITTHFYEDEWLKLWQFNVPSGGPWPLMITIEGDPAVPAWALYLDETYTGGAPISDNDAYTSTMNDGTGAIHLTDPQPGNHCLLVYRNPVHGGDPIDVTIEIQAWPPEFQHYIPAGWYRSITPRPAPDGTLTYAPMPDTLLGNVASTYFNISCENDSPTDAPFLNANIDLDGVPSWWLAWGLFPGGGVSIFNWTTAHTIRGGRHMLAFKLDPYEQIEEVREDDNVWGQQYCWSPLAVPVGTIVSRAAPPERTGGWFDNTSEEPLWYNCDGLRLPSTGSGWWKAVAVMPGASSNVDVRLHDPLVGAVDGFGAHLTYSGWPMGNSDYVLVNYNSAPTAPYDAGVLRIGGSQNYNIHSAGSVFHEWDGEETYGPYVMGAGEIVHLHEFLLNGPVQFSLHNLGGSVDWGITLHTHGEPFLSKSDAPDSCYAWLNGPGMNEHLSAQIEVQTFYCLAVWKRDSASLPLEGTYELYVSDIVTGVESSDDTPSRTALASVYPNPFNPQTKIEYYVASQQHVVLEIFDISGAKVRGLVDEVLPAQRHVVEWDGRDDAGNAVASGVYFLRMAAGDITDVKKLVLLK
jgi:hypothetical protein